MLKIEKLVKKLVTLLIIIFKHYICCSLNELSFNYEFNYIAKYIVQLELSVPSLIMLCCRLTYI